MRAILFLLLAAHAINALAEPLPPLKPIRRSLSVFQEGYALGHIATTGQHRFRGTLGHMTLGLNSSAGGIIDPACVNKRERELEATPDKHPPTATPHEDARDFCLERINPFMFSSLQKDWPERIERIQGPGALSLIRYKIYPFNNPLLRSPNVIKDVVEVKPYDVPERSVVDPHQKTFFGLSHMKTQDVEGRIVKAYTEGYLRSPSYIELQVSNAGDHFLRIAVPSVKLFDAMVGFMATGRLVRVHYYQAVWGHRQTTALLHGYKTDLRAWGADLED